MVVDASVLAVALADDSRDGDLVRSRLAADPFLHAPHLVDLEVLSLLRLRVRTEDLDKRRADLALADLEELPLTRYPHLPFARRVWELRRNVTPYDAAYVALAEALV
ncbi:MAG: type II toxin-antitoxin system VapC family toxin [Actinomycetota bacterium]